MGEGRNENLGPFREVNGSELPNPERHEMWDDQSGVLVYDRLGAPTGEVALVERGGQAEEVAIGVTVVDEHAEALVEPLLVGQGDPRDGQVPGLFFERLTWVRQQIPKKA